jgi:maleylpyruvate isomerase
MAEAGPVPESDLRRVADAQEHFFAVTVGLGDVDVRQPSLLPGWSVAHVLTHVARNADSHRRRAEAARRAEVVEQYPGGYAGRAAEIDRGAGRAARELIDDVQSSTDAMWDAWRRVPDVAWVNVTRDVGGRERPLGALPARRWQELEVHVIDLNVGVTHREWPDEFVAHWLAPLRATVRERLPAGAQSPEAGLLDDRDELAWLYGRLQRVDLPDLAPWS